MDRTKALKFLQSTRSETLKAGNKTIRFSRQQENDIDGIEKASSKAITVEWKSLVYMNYIYCNISLCEMQRITLLEMEIDTRNDIDMKSLQKWFNTTLEAEGAK